MSDALLPFVDIPLVLGPNDKVMRLFDLLRTGKRGEVEREIYYAVVHRNSEVWTHVYRVAPARWSGKPVVHLEKLFSGDRLGEAKVWAMKGVSERGDAGALRLVA